MAKAGRLVVTAGNLGGMLVMRVQIPQGTRKVSIGFGRKCGSLPLWSSGEKMWILQRRPHPLLPASSRKSLSRLINGGAVIKADA